ncbi:uncharacterized protein LOC126696853 isoform X2 [Quercus robur]|uniref:uncharacterized protein LOC126696853 isoform X2 n=1 Tax=Quercus robur TaxID=38942 RepID=UPI002161DB79|nr:uncharacterized protein LOC126696853 isoform X2 [Quercus robur]
MWRWRKRRERCRRRMGLGRGFCGGSHIGFCSSKLMIPLDRLSLHFSGNAATKAWETLKGRPHNIDLELTEVELPSIFGLALLTLVMEHKLIAPHQKVEDTSRNNAARNHSNDCVASMQKNIKCSEKGSHAQMMAEVEALACHRAVEFPKKIQLSEVILEGDAEVIIQQLQSCWLDSRGKRKKKIPFNKLSMRKIDLGSVKELRHGSCAAGQTIRSSL